VAQISAAGRRGDGLVLACCPPSADEPASDDNLTGVYPNPAAVAATTEIARGFFSRLALDAGGRTTKTSCDTSTGRSERILEKINEYRSLMPEERELRLQATELR
jgi:hypothetical protein